MKNKITVPDNTAVVVLYSCGNPDFGQYAPLSHKRIKPCKTFEDAVKHCREYIQEYDLGGGNWNGGYILHPTKGVIAQVSYNGRVWESKGSDCHKMDRKEITEITASIIQPITQNLYILLDDGTKKEYNSIPRNTYACYGYQDEADKGRLTVHYLNALRPLCDSTTDKQLLIIDKAGQTFDGTNWKP